MWKSIRQGVPIIVLTLMACGDQPQLTEPEMTPVGPHFSLAYDVSVLDVGTISLGHVHINDAGQVTGSRLTAEGVPRAFLWTPGAGVTDLGTLGARSSFARDINNRGEVVGWTENSAFRWSAESGMVPLGGLDGLRGSSLVVRFISSPTYSMLRSGAGAAAVLWRRASSRASRDRRA